MKPKIYIDTSVIGGYFDKEFEKYAKKLFDKVEETGSIILLSNVALDEVAEAPERVQNFAQSLFYRRIERLSLDDESRSLA